VRNQPDTPFNSRMVSQLCPGCNWFDCWMNYLRASIKKGAWTVDEEELIKDVYSIFGPK
jgi:hypothetical protein